MLLVIGLVAAVVGCGEATPSVSPTPLATATPEPTPTILGSSLDVRAWTAGFVLVVEDATGTFDTRGGIVDATIRFENPGPDEAALDVPIRLTSGGSGWEPHRDTPVPLVPAGGAMQATLRFTVDRPVDPRSLVIRVGRAADHQVVVPLGLGLVGQDPVATATLRPVSRADDATVKAGQLTIRLTGAELRYDLPDWRLTLPNDTVLLTLTYDATYTGSFSGGFAFSGENIRLRLADGTAITARPDGRSQAIELLLPKVAATGLVSRFEIPVDAAVLDLVITDGSKSAALELFVPGREP